MSLTDVTFSYCDNNLVLKYKKNNPVFEKDTKTTYIFTGLYEQHLNCGV